MSSPLLIQKFNDAKNFIIRHLSRYGIDEYSNGVWDILGKCYLELGLQFENSGKYKEALKEYSSINENSIHFEKANMAINRLMATDKNDEIKQQTIVKLMNEADNYYSNGKYTDAYYTYKLMLSFEPSNHNVIKQIERIKENIKGKADKGFQERDYDTALLWYDQYAQIDPQDQFVKEKINECKKMLEGTDELEKSSIDEKGKLGRIFIENGINPKDLSPDAIKFLTKD